MFGILDFSLIICKMTQNSLDSNFQTCFVKYKVRLILTYVVNTIFDKNDFLSEPKVALTKEMVFFDFLWKTAGIANFHDHITNSFNPFLTHVRESVNKFYRKEKLPGCPLFFLI